MLDLTIRDDLSGVPVGTLAEDMPAGATVLRIDPTPGFAPPPPPFPAAVGEGRNQDRCRITAVNGPYYEVRWEFQGRPGRFHAKGEPFRLVGLGQDVVQSSLRLDALSRAPAVRYLDELLAALFGRETDFIEGVWGNPTLEVVPDAPPGPAVRVTPGALVVRNEETGTSRIFALGPDLADTEGRVELVFPGEGTDEALIFVDGEGTLSVAYGAAWGSVSEDENVYRPLAQVRLDARKGRVDADDIVDLRGPRTRGNGGDSS